MEQCTGWKGLAQEGCEKTGKYALLEKVDGKYVLNKIYNPYKTDSSRILIQDSKVKVFYFKAGESDALITCFKKKISENKSEFRHMPGDDMVFGKEDYNSIYDLKNDESINKFRGIEKISIDKFELSKLLGKYLRIGGLVSDTKETGFERHIKRMFDNKGLVENYGAWEKIIEILVINESWDNLSDFVKTIMKAINSVEYAKDGKLCEQIKKSLCLYLNACLTKSLSLVWGNEVKDIIGDICKNTNIRKSKFLRRRKGYCSTRMNDKSVMPILVDMLDLPLVFRDSKAINLCDFRQAIEYCKDSWDENYIYYPYLVTMYDLAIIECVRGLVKESSEGFKDYYNSFKRQYAHYIKCNYQIEEDRLEHILRVENISNHFSDKDNCYYTEINNERKDKLKLAIANVRLNHDNFKKVIMDIPNRSYKRYKDLAKVINEAIDAKADMLILPEGYLPYEWLATLSRTCAKSNLAVVTGIEHIKKGSSVYNLTAVILPYEDEFSKNAFVSFHLKTHYAPGEKHEINGYRLNAISGSHYELYKWHDCYFPVYCCYEIASIVDRSLFQSYADFLVTIEWNKDINYYSNILESLSRDIHTYCIQVNSSDYGDSRIAKPSKTEDKDIMRTKGGKNSTILVDEIDIKKLREFQFKEYNLQAYDKNFKPTPPGFKPDIVLKKIRGEYLFDETR